MRIFPPSQRTPRPFVAHAELAANGIVHCVPGELPVICVHMRNVRKKIAW